MKNLKFFNENGYFIIDKVFSKEQCNELVHLALELNNKDNLVPIMNIHNLSGKILDYMSNDLIIDFINNFFQTKAYGLQTEYFFMPPGTKGFSAHQDNTYVQASSDSFISAWIALQDVTSFNGGLIIWPGTHKEKQLELVENEVEPSKNQDPNARKMSSVIPKKYKAFSPKISLGSVIFIHSWLVHASNNNESNNNRNALLCTYIKEGADFRSGNYANREAFSLNGHK